MLVYPGFTQAVYGDAPVNAGCATVTCLRPGVTLHYKFRIKTWSYLSFLLFFCLYRTTVMSSKEKHRTDTNWTAQPHTVDGDLKIQIKLLEES